MRFILFLKVPLVTFVVALFSLGFFALNFFFIGFKLDKVCLQAHGIVRSNEGELHDHRGIKGNFFKLTSNLFGCL